MNNASTYREFADRVRAAADIEEVVGQYVELKRAGSRLKGCCPFHQEKTPSFFIHPTNQIFKCFGCGKGGDVISFVREIERVDFREALEILGQKYHVEIPRFSARGENDEHLKFRRILQDTLRVSAEFYARRLKDPEQGAFARRYLTERGVKPEMIEGFQLGVAGEAWDDLERHLRQKGFSEKAMIESGVCMARKSGQGVYDYMRERLVFPILNRQGTPVGFGGRIFSGDGPKYLNSKDTELFQKGRELYGLCQARDAMTRGKQAAVLVEGYMDVIGCHQAGVTTAVASLGTALTPDQARLIHRFNRHVVFLYDADEAGVNAILRGLEILLAAGLEVRVGRMPAGEDPDSLAQKHGPEALRLVIETAVPFFDFLIEQSRRKFDMDAPESRFAALKLFEPALLSISEPLVFTGYLSKLSSELGHDESLLVEHFAKLRRQMKSREGARSENSIRVADSTPRAATSDNPGPPRRRAVSNDDGWSPAPPPDLDEMEDENSAWREAGLEPPVATPSSVSANAAAESGMGELARLAGPANRRDKGLLQILLSHADARVLARDRLRWEWFEHPLIRYWTRRVLESESGWSELYHNLPDTEEGREHQRFLQELVCQEDEPVADNYLLVAESMIDLVEAEFHLAENRRLNQRIQESLRKGDKAAVRELVERQKKNANERFVKRNRATKENPCAQVRN
jgi:DNA primase